MKAWRYRFKLARQGTVKESVFAIADYTTAPHGETPEEANARRNGGRFTLAEACDDRAKPMAVASFRQALNVLGWSGKYSPHATRTTGSTRLNEMGYPADWIERQLAHFEPNAVRRTYNHA